MAREVTVECPACKGEVAMTISRDNYGADADGNRGMWVDEAEVIYARCGCDWTDAQYEQMSQAAIKASYEDEADFYGLEVEA